MLLIKIQAQVDTIVKYIVNRWADLNYFLSGSGDGTSLVKPVVAGNIVPNAQVKLEIDIIIQLFATVFA